MQADVARDLSDSIAAFDDVVWPVVGPWLGGGKTVPVESTRSTDILDGLGGIDRWHVLGDMMRGLAIRIQWGEPWNTFTIRYDRGSGNPTEYQKRLRAIEHNQQGWLMPAITIQAYLSEREHGELLSVAAITTKDLIDFIKDLDDKNPYTRETHDNTAFIYVPWDELHGSGIRIFRCYQGWGK